MQTVSLYTFKDKKRPILSAATSKCEEDLSTRSVESKSRGSRIFGNDCKNSKYFAVGITKSWEYFPVLKEDSNKDYEKIIDFGIN